MSFHGHWALYVYKYTLYRIYIQYVVYADVCMYLYMCPTNFRVLILKNIYLSLATENMAIKCVSNFQSVRPLKNILKRGKGEREREKWCKLKANFLHVCVVVVVCNNIQHT